MRYMTLLFDEEVTEGLSPNRTEKHENITIMLYMFHHIDSFIVNSK